ncbi:MAG: MFS transporter [Candidatus Thiodiazotropha sp.]
MRLTIVVLLGGLSVLLVGLGLLGTLLGVRATIEQFSYAQTGVVMAGYYVGYIVGTWRGPSIIRRVGHIRTFAALSALCATTTLLFGFLADPWTWFFLRILNGASVVGLYMVVESWLNEKTPANKRGRVFAIYMITTLMALASGQFLLLVYEPSTLFPFALASVLITLAIIPIAVVRVAEPAIDTHQHLPLLQLFTLSPLGAVGSICAGTVNGAFWGMTPMFGIRVGMQEVDIALLMSATIVGGALLQLPIGHLSDRYDRRTILLLVSFAGAVTSGIAGMMVLWDSAGLNLVAFLYGGLMFSVYAISVAHTNDYLESTQVLGATQGLLLLYGFGALIGPLVGGWLMSVVGAAGLPIFSSLTLLLFCIFGLYRMTQRASPSIEDQTDFVPLARTSPVMMEMHPQTDTDMEPDLVDEKSDS